MSLRNDQNDIGQGQRSLCATHRLMPVIICAHYGKNPPRIERAVERTRQDVPYFSSLFLKNQGWITLKICVKIKGHYARHTLSCQWSFVSIAKSWLKDLGDRRSFLPNTEKSIQHYRSYRADTEGQMDGRGETNLPRNNFVVRGV